MIKDMTIMKGMKDEFDMLFLSFLLQNNPCSNCKNTVT